VLREVSCLVEAAFALPGSMERHGDQDVGARKDVCAGCAHPPRQVPRDAGAPVVLQRVHDGAQRSFVGSDRSRQGDLRFAAAAAPASVIAVASPFRLRAEFRVASAFRRKFPPCLQRLAAGAAAGGRDGDDGGPAAAADGAARRLVERQATGRARRRQDDGDGAVGERPQERFSCPEEARRTPRYARRPPTSARVNRTPGSAA